MAQKSITSFFKLKPSPVAAKPDNKKEDESAEKTSGSKRLRIVSSSDEETAQRKEKKGRAKKSRGNSVELNKSNDDGKRTRKKIQVKNRYNGLVDSESEEDSGTPKKAKSTKKEDEVMVIDSDSQENDKEEENMEVDAEESKETIKDEQEEKCPSDATKKDSEKQPSDSEKEDIKQQESATENSVSTNKIESSTEPSVSPKSEKENVKSEANKTPKKSIKTPINKKSNKSNTKVKETVKKTKAKEQIEVKKASEEEEEEDKEAVTDEKKETKTSPVEKPKGKVPAMFISNKSKTKNVKDSVQEPKVEDKNEEEKEAKEVVTPEKKEAKEELTPEKKEAETTPAEKPKAKVPLMFMSNKADISLAQNTDGADFNPAKEKYHPINDVFWKEGEKTPYLALARTFQLIEEIRGRYNMLDILGNLFSSILLLNPDDLLPAVYLSVNQLAPAYEGLELGVAETFIMKAICSATGRAMKFIKEQAHATGDLGIVAEQSRVAQRMMFRPAALTIQDTFKKLKEIGKLSSGSDKTDKIQTMLVACRYSEARFIIRSLLGKLRIGLAEQSLMMALAIALVRSGYIKRDVPPGKLNNKGKINTDEKFKQKVEEKAMTLKIAYCQCPNYDKIIPTLLEHGLDELLERCPMLPGIPVKPMLAQPTKGVVEVLKRLDGLKITCEWKYDGERAQIHFDKKTGVKIYSRNQEDNTSKYPDVIARLKNFVNPEIESYILDSEIVAWDCARKQILPFQILSTRKRKNADINEIKVQVCIYAFDLLYLNGKPLVTEVLFERRRHLREQFKEVEGEFQFATSADTNDADEVVQFLEESIKGNCEGLMVKTLQEEATYEIAKRSRNWLKLKKDYMAGVGDSLDLVVVGGYRGKGKRTGGYGGFLLACYDSDNEEYQTICKIGTGFSDEDLQTHANFFKEHVLPAAKSYYSYDKSLEPDDWFDAVQVWEVKCADLSLSPVHRAGIGIIDAERGISLRFPRFIRIRDDKTAENATTAQQVVDMYQSQDQIKNQQTDQANNSFENDFY